LKEEESRDKNKFMRNTLQVLGIFIFSGFLLSCATTTDEGSVGVKRTQFLQGASSDQIRAEAAKSYEQTKQDAQKKGQLDKNPSELQRVVAVSKRLIPQTAIFRKDALGWAWEVHVITSPELNAYCMPGGKIIFYSDIIEKLNLTDGEIAAIMGHEMSHALREHGRERISEAMAEQVGLGVLVATGVVKPQYAGVAAMAASVFYDLPHSRTQESEADTMGVELMARAGYDPRDALNLWKKMGSMGGSKPPEILSTHPADQVRLNHIASLLPTVLPLYEQSTKAPH